MNGLTVFTVRVLIRHFGDGIRVVTGVVFIGAAPQNGIAFVDMLNDGIAIGGTHENGQLDNAVAVQRIGIVITAMRLRVYPTGLGFYRVVINTFFGDKLTLTVGQLTKMKRV